MTENFLTDANLGGKDSVALLETKRARRKEYRARYYAENRDKIIAASREWNRANPEKARAAVAKWRESNAEKEKQRRAERHQANLAKENVQSAAWRKANPEKRSIAKL